MSDRRIDLKDLVKAGVHFGHQTSRWVPKMDPYIWGVKNKVHLIDVSKTAHQMERAGRFLESVVASGKQVLFVGTKKSARDIIQAVAGHVGMPYVNHRWIGGTLSNFSQVKKSVTRLLHYEDVLAKAEKYPHYTKKELNEIQKSVNRLQAIVGGMRKLTWPVGALVLVDVNKEHSALKEAVSMGVPVVALVDTNADPSYVDYVIPANDDAPKSIQVILEYLQGAVEEGKKHTTKEAAVEKVVAEEVVIAEEVIPAIELAFAGDEEESDEKKAIAKKSRPVVRTKKEDEDFGAKGGLKKKAVKTK